MAEYRGKRNRNKNEPDIFMNILGAIGTALWSLITLPFRSKKRSRLDQTKYRAQWQMIITSAATDSSSAHWAQAVADADKLLDLAMRESGLSGETFADRLRSAQTRIRPEFYQAIWDAHKLRNSLAHEVGYQVNKPEANRALGSFEAALRALGAL